MCFIQSLKNVYFMIFIKINNEIVYSVYKSWSCQGQYLHDLPYFSAEALFLVKIMQEMLFKFILSTTDNYQKFENQLS